MLMRNAISESGSGSSASLFPLQDVTAPVAAEQARAPETPPPPAPEAPPPPSPEEYAKLTAEVKSLGASTEGLNEEAKIADPAKAEQKTAEIVKNLHQHKNENPKLKGLPANHPNVKQACVDYLKNKTEFSLLPEESQRHVLNTLTFEVKTYGEKRNFEKVDNHAFSRDEQNQIIEGEKKLTPADRMAALMRAEAEKRKGEGNPTQIARFYEKALAFQPANPENHDALARSYEEIGRKTEDPAIQQHAFETAKLHLEKSGKIEAGDLSALQRYRDLSLALSGKELKGEELRQAFDGKMKAFQAALAANPSAARKIMADLEVLARQLQGAEAKTPQEKFDNLKRAQTFHQNALELHRSRPPKESATESEKADFEARANELKAGVDEAKKSLGALREKLLPGLQSCKEKAFIPEQLSQAKLCAQISKSLGNPENLAKDLSAWKNLLKTAPEGAIPTRERVDQLGDLLKQYSLLRHESGKDLSRSRRGVTVVEEGELPPLALETLSAEMKEVKSMVLDQAGAIEGKGVLSPSGLKHLENLLHQVTDGNDRLSLRHLSFEGLQNYLQGCSKADEKLAKALELKDPAQKRNALLGALREYTQLREGAQVDAVAAVLENDLGLGLDKSALQNAREKMPVYAAMMGILRGSELPQEERVKSFGLSAADTLVDTTTENKNDRAQNLISAHQFFEQAGSPEKAERVVSELREIQEGFTLRLLDPQFTEAKGRLELAGTVVQIDQTLLPRDLQSIGISKSPDYDKTVMSERIQRNAGLLQEALEAKNLPVETRLEKAMELTTALQAYQDLSRGEKPILKHEALQNRRSALENSLKEMLGESVQKGLQTLQTQSKPPLSAEELKARTGEILLHHEKTLHDSLAKNELQGLFSLHPNAVASFAKDLNEAHRLLAEAQKGGKDAFGNAFQAAGLFAQLGISDRVKDSLDPVLRMAESGKIPPASQGKILASAAQIYLIADMKPEADQTLNRIVALSGPKASAEVKEMAVIAQGLKAMGDGDLEEAKKCFKKIPGNETAQNFLENIGKVEEAQKKAAEEKALRSLNALTSVMSAYSGYLEKDLTGNLQDGSPQSQKILAAHEETMKSFLKEAKFLVTSGECASIPEALDNLSHSPNFQKSYHYFFSAKDDSVKSSLQLIRDLSNPFVSDADYSRGMLKAVLKLQEGGQFNAVSGLARDLANDPTVGGDAKQILEKLPDTIFWHEMGKQLKNASIIYAENFDEAIFSLGTTVLGFGVGKLVAVGAKTALAGRAVWMTQAAVKAGWSARTVGAVARAGAMGVEAAAMGSEAVGVTLTNMKVATLQKHLQPGSGAKEFFKEMMWGHFAQDFEASHFWKETGSMMVMFGLGKAFGAGVDKLAQGTLTKQVGHYFAGVGSFFSSKYANEALGLHTSTDDQHYNEKDKWYQRAGKRLVDSFVGDLSMKLGGHLAHKTPGVARLEARAQQLMTHNQFLPQMSRLGLVNARAEFTPEGKTLMEGVLKNLQTGVSNDSIIRQLEKMSPKEAKDPAALQKFFQTLGIVPPPPHVLPDSPEGRLKIAQGIVDLHRAGFDFLVDAQTYENARSYVEAAQNGKPLPADTAFLHDYQAPGRQVELNGKSSDVHVSVSPSTEKNPSEKTYRVVRAEPDGTLTLENQEGKVRKIALSKKISGIYSEGDLVTVSGGSGAKGETGEKEKSDFSNLFDQIEKIGKAGHLNRNQIEWIQSSAKRAIEEALEQGKPFPDVHAAAIDFIDSLQHELMVKQVLKRSVSEAVLEAFAQIKPSPRSPSWNPSPRFEPEFERLAKAGNLNEAQRAHLQEIVGRGILEGKSPKEIQKEANAYLEEIPRNGWVQKILKGAVSKLIEQEHQNAAAPSQAALSTGSDYQAKSSYLSVQRLSSSLVRTGDLDAKDASAFEAALIQLIEKFSSGPENGETPQEFKMRKDGDIALLIGDHLMKHFVDGKDEKSPHQMAFLRSDIQKLIDRAQKENVGKGVAEPDTETEAASSATPVRPAQPKAAPPKAEPSKAEPPKAEPPKAASPKAEPPKAEVKGADAPAAPAPKSPENPEQPPLRKKLIQLTEALNHRITELSMEIAEGITPEVIQKKLQELKSRGIDTGKIGEAEVVLFLVKSDPRVRLFNDLVDANRNPKKVIADASKLSQQELALQVSRLLYDAQKAQAMGDPLVADLLNTRASLLGTLLEGIAPKALGEVPPELDRIKPELLRKISEGEIKDIPQAQRFIQGKAAEEKAGQEAVKTPEAELLADNVPTEDNSRVRSARVDRSAARDHGDLSVKTHPGVGYTKQKEINGKTVNIEVNEDGAVLLHGADGRPLGGVVLDGMGGLGGGDKASSIAGKKIADYVKQNSHRIDPSRPETAGTVLAEAMKEASQAINQDPQYGNSGTVGVGYMVVNRPGGKPVAVMVHVGDAGAVVIGQRGEVKHRTKDQSQVQGLWDSIVHDSVPLEEQAYALSLNPHGKAPEQLQAEADYQLGQHVGINVWGMPHAKARQEIQKALASKMGLDTAGKDPAQIESELRAAEKNGQAELWMRTNPNANVVLGNMGAGFEAHPVVSVVPLEKGDRIVLFSDGVGDNHSTQDLAQMASKSASASEAQSRIMDSTLHRMKELNRVLTTPELLQKINAGERVEVTLPDGKKAWLDGENYDVYDAASGGKKIDHLKADNATAMVYEHNPKEAPAAPPPGRTAPVAPKNPPAPEAAAKSSASPIPAEAAPTAASAGSSFLDRAAEGAGQLIEGGKKIAAQARDVALQLFTGSAFLFMGVGGLGMGFVPRRPRSVILPPTGGVQVSVPKAPRSPAANTEKQANVSVSIYEKLYPTPEMRPGYVKSEILPEIENTANTLRSQGFGKIADQIERDYQTALNHPEGSPEFDGATTRLALVLDVSRHESRLPMHISEPEVNAGNVQKIEKKLQRFEYEKGLRERSAALKTYDDALAARQKGDPLSPEQRKTLENPDLKAKDGERAQFLKKHAEFHTLETSIAPENPLYQRLETGSPSGSSGLSFTLGRGQVFRHAQALLRFAEDSLTKAYKGEIPPGTESPVTVNVIGVGPVQGKMQVTRSGGNWVIHVAFEKPVANGTNAMHIVGGPRGATGKFGLHDVSPGEYAAPAETAPTEAPPESGVRKTPRGLDIRFTDAQGKPFAIFVPDGQSMANIDLSLSRGRTSRPDADPAQMAKELVDRIASKDPKLLQAVADYHARTGQGLPILALYEIATKMPADGLRILENARQYQDFKFQVAGRQGSGEVQFTGRILGVGSARTIYEGLFTNAKGEKIPVAIKMPPGADIKNLLTLDNAQAGDGRFYGTAEIRLGEDGKPAAKFPMEQGPTALVTNLAEGVLVKGLHEVPAELQDAVCREMVEDLGKLVPQGFLDFMDRNFVVRTQAGNGRRLQWIDLEGIRFGEPPKPEETAERYRSALGKMGVPQKYWPEHLKPAAPVVPLRPAPSTETGFSRGVSLRGVSFDGKMEASILTSSADKEQISFQLGANGEVAAGGAAAANTLFTLNRLRDGYRIQFQSGVKNADVVFVSPDGKSESKKWVGEQQRLAPGNYKVTVNGKEISFSVPDLPASSEPMRMAAQPASEQPGSRSKIPPPSR
ncbi:MAG: protein phosphatase 2C domain-containing protein [bacterium]